MSKPVIHAKSSSKRYGGTPDSYIDIHQWMDSSKSYFGDNRHRLLWHSTAGCFYVEKIFGINYEKLEQLRIKYDLPESFIKDYENQKQIDRESGTELRNSEGRKFSIRDVAEQHCLEDFRHKFIPTPQDYLSEMFIKDWMNNGVGELPDSAKNLYKNKMVRESNQVITNQTVD